MRVIKKHGYIIKIRESIKAYELGRVGVEGKENKRKIVIGWIQGHCGIRGNELIDGLDHNGNTG